MHPLQNADAAVIYILGQSNAHGHDQVLADEDRICTPMSHVFSLDRKENQAFGLEEITWSGYTTQGKNLGETQDDRYCFAYYLATAWEKTIASGVKLPDLYIVQISIGAQSILNGMWNPAWPRSIKPGSWETSNISLYPLAMEILPLVYKDLSRRYQNPCAIGLHWIGSEEDTISNTVYPPDFSQRYDDFFDTILQAVGFPCPVSFYEISCTRREGFDKEGIKIVNKELFRQTDRLNATMVRLKESPLWDEADDQQGIFSGDHTHYSAATQKWLVEHFWQNLMGTSLP